MKECICVLSEEIPTALEVDYCPPHHWMLGDTVCGFVEMTCFKCGKCQVEKVDYSCDQIGIIDYQIGEDFKW